MMKGNELFTQGGESDRVKQGELDSRANTAAPDHLQSLIQVKGGATGWNDEAMEKVSLLSQELAPGGTTQRRWRTRSLDMGHDNSCRQGLEFSNGSLWQKPAKETAIDVDHSNVASRFKTSTLPNLSETRIYSHTESDLSKDNSAMSSLRRFSAVDSDSSNSSQRGLPPLLTRFPSNGDHHYIAHGLSENPALSVVSGGGLSAAIGSERTLKGYGDKCDRGEDIGSLRHRRGTSSQSSQRHSFRDEELVTKTSAVPCSHYNRAKSRFSEPRKSVAEKGAGEGSLRKSGVLKSGQLRSQQLKSGNLWSGQLRSQKLKSGMLPSLGQVKEEEDDPFRDVDLPDRPKFKKKRSWVWFFEMIAFFILLAGVICSRVLSQARNLTLWGLLLWKWILLALVVVCGRLVSGWVTRALVFLLEMNFLTRRRVLYFVYALRHGVRNCIWLASVLMAWNFMFDSKAQASSKKLVYVTKVLQCFLLAAVLFIIKVFLVKVLASSFHVGIYFERIRDSLFNQHILEVLSGPPVVELERMREEDEKLMDEVAMLKEAGAVAPGLTGLPGISEGSETFRREKAAKQSRTGVPAEVEPGSGITVQHLHKLNRQNVSAFNMKRLVNMVRTKGVSTFGQGLDENSQEDGEMDTEIRSEWQAKAVAKEIFANVAKPNNSCITEDDLMRFLQEEDAIRALAVFDGAMETGKITKTALKAWVVNVYQERRALALSLSDTKTAVNKLHRMIDCLLFLIVIVIWLLILEVATRQLLIFVSSQLLLVVFIFGNTLKTVFEAIIFVFVFHPFDVGDRCVIDGTMYVVEEMNILTTVFLGDFGAKVWYPNSVLAIKPITNYYRSPDMTDMFEFYIAATTPAERIERLKEAIGRYVSSQTKHWKETFTLNCMDCSPQTRRLKLVLAVTHTMNYQNFGERTSRRSELILEMKRLFEDLQLEYHLPPQEVQLKSVEGTSINLSRQL